MNKDVTSHDLARMWLEDEDLPVVYGDSEAGLIRVVTYSIDEPDAWEFNSEVQPKVIRLDLY